MFKRFNPYKKINMYGFMAMVNFILLSFTINVNKHKEPFLKIRNIQVWLGTYIFIYLLFAKMFFILFDSNQKISLHNILNFHNGGLSSFGGQTGAVLTFVYHSYNYHIPIVYIIDSIVLLIPITACCIRIGNIYNQRLKPRFKEHFILKHNLWIELFFHGFIFGGIVWYTYITKYKPGCLINIWSKYYVTIRFLTEFLREGKKYYNLYYNGIAIGIWQVCCFINMNPFHTILIIDQYCKQHITRKRAINFFNKFILMPLVPFLLHLNNYLIFIGVISYLIDILAFGKPRNYIYIIGNLGNISLLLGILLQVLNIDIGNTNFYYNYLS